MPLKTHIDEQPSLNLTPMIDIVFLLIIFFMVGTKFSELERKIGLKPPSVADNGALSAAPESKVVNVFRDGHIELDNQRGVLHRESTAQTAPAMRRLNSGRGRAGSETTFEDLEIGLLKKLFSES